MRDLILSSDEAKCGVRFKLFADWPVLGRKLRKDVGKVRKGLESVTSDDAKSYMETGKLNVAGVDLVEGDLRVIRYVETKEIEGTFESNTDGNIVVLLDIQQRPELQMEGTAREVVNRIQRLRKKAGLVATDEVDAFYSFEKGVGEALAACIESQEEAFMKALRRKPLPETEKKANAKVILQEEQEVGEDKFLLTLAWA